MGDERVGRIRLLSSFTNYAECSILLCWLVLGYVTDKQPGFRMLLPKVWVERHEARTLGKGSFALSQLISGAFLLQQTSELCNINLVGMPDECLERRNLPSIYLLISFSCCFFFFPLSLSPSQASFLCRKHLWGEVWGNCLCLPVCLLRLFNLKAKKSTASGRRKQSFLLLRHWKPANVG